MTLRDNWPAASTFSRSADPPHKRARRGVTCWHLSCLCSARVSKDPSLPCRWPTRGHLRQGPPQRWSAWFAPRCVALGSAAWEAPARLAAGQSFPVAFCGSAGGAAGRGAPRWLPAPRGWPGSGGCFCSATDGRCRNSLRSQHLPKKMLLCSRCRSKNIIRKKSTPETLRSRFIEIQYVCVCVFWPVLTKLRSNCQVNKMAVLFSPQVPHFASAGLQESSAALPHLHSHFHCLKNIPPSHCDLVDGWGTQRRVTVEAISAWKEHQITTTHYLQWFQPCLTSVCPRSLLAVSQFLPSQLQSVCAAPAQARSAPPALLGSHFPDYGENNTENILFHLILML